MSHLAILERTPQPTPEVLARVATVAADVEADTAAMEELPLANGAPAHLIVE